MTGAGAAKQCYAHFIWINEVRTLGAIVLSLNLISEYTPHLFFLILQNLFCISAFGDQ